MNKWKGDSNLNQRKGQCFGIDEIGVTQDLSETLFCVTPFF
jgi:hypothetical protein